MWCHFVSLGPRDGRVSHPVKETDHDFVLLDALPVEVSSHDLREVFFGLSSEFRLSCHGRRVKSDPGPAKDKSAVAIGKGGRGIEMVFAAVLVEDFAVKGRPV